MLTLTASGSVNDFSDNDKLSLQQKVADAAHVDKTLVTIRVAAASVRVIATIAVPASMTVDEVQTSLSSALGTADAASTALGVTVEEVPTTTVALAEPPSMPRPQPPSPSPPVPSPLPPPPAPKPLYSPPTRESPHDESPSEETMTVEFIVIAAAASIGGAAALLCLCYFCCASATSTTSALLRLVRKAVLKKKEERREKISPQRSTVEIVARNAAPATEEIVAGNPAQDQINHARVQATVERVRRQQEQRSRERSAQSSIGTVPSAAHEAVPAPATSGESESESESERV